MPIEIWFPSFVFYQDLSLEPAARQSAIEAVRDHIDAATLKRDGYVTSNNTRNDLHLDPRMAALLEAFRAPLDGLLHEHLKVDRTNTRFCIGRCWPVYQTDNGASGRLHYHSGAVLSAVFYLLAPAGSGGLEFYKPVETVLDNLPVTERSALTYRTTEYAAVPDRLMVFCGELRHRRRANTGTSDSLERIAVAFDLFSSVDLAVLGGGRPHAEQLREFP